MVVRGAGLIGNAEMGAEFMAAKNAVGKNGSFNAGKWYKTLTRYQTYIFVIAITPFVLLLIYGAMKGGKITLGFKNEKSNNNTNNDGKKPQNDKRC